MGSLVTILALPLTAALTLGAGPAAMGLLAIPFLVLSPLASTSAGTVANIQQWSLRQVVTPDYLFGRVTASHRFIVDGIEAAGALMGGVLGGLLGPRLAIAVWSPRRRLRVQPEPPWLYTGQNVLRAEYECAGQSTRLRPTRMAVPAPPTVPRYFSLKEARHGSGTQW